jgi:3-oxoacyl-[acyl-carrier-protein] synthase III
VAAAQVSVGIIGAGKALGSRIETNEELCLSIPSITPAWVVEKTGITQRHKVIEGETTSSLALAAAQQAIASSGIDKADIGMVIVCTAFGDYMFPSVAARLHRDLGLSPEALCFDINQNCSGFIAALVTAYDRMEADDTVNCALVVGAEVLSPYIDPTDPNTAPFFSDGAGAVVLGRLCPKWNEGVGIVSSAFTMDTSSYEAVRCLRGGKIEQEGLVTWRLAVKRLPGVIRTAVERAGWAMEDVDVFLPHQANLVLLEFLASRLGWKDKLFTNVATVGNCGAASALVALASAMEEGRIGAGDKVVFAGIGAGFSFGAICLEW